jgi:hypothetical protein
LADRSAANDVSLTLGKEGGEWFVATASESTPVFLTNQGRSPVVILTLRPIGDGYPTVTTSTPLVPGLTQTFDLPPGSTCPQPPAFAVPTKLEVTARTTRGTTVTRVLTLPTALVDFYRMTENTRCGLAPTSSSVRLEITSAVRTASGADVTYVLRNSSPYPVELRGWKSMPGITARTNVLNLVVPAADARPATLRVRFRVTSCAEWERASRPGHEPELVHGFLRATAIRIDGTTVLPMLVNADVFEESPDPNQGLSDLLVRQCPNRRLAS